MLNSCFSSLVFNVLLDLQIEYKWSIFVTINLNCGLHSFCRKTTWTEVKFLDSSVVKTESDPIFGFPYTPNSHYQTPLIVTIIHP